MREHFYVYTKDQYVGDMYYDTEKKEYSYVANPDADPDLQNYWLYVSNADKDPKWFKDTLENCRCIDPNRVNLREILHKHNMLTLDPHEFMVKNKFTSSNDFCWATKEYQPDLFWWHPLSILLPECEEMRRKLGIPLDLFEH